MKLATEWMDGMLIPSTVLCLALLHRLDVLVLVLPVLILADYAVAERSKCQNSGQRKI